MKKSIEIKKIKIGEGRPKICVSLTSKTTAELLEEAKLAKASPVDVVEWRLDYHDEVFHLGKMLLALNNLTKVLEDLPLLVTFRTKAEGGEKEITYDYYKTLNEAMISSQKIDLIDVELFSGDQLVKELISFAHDHQVIVVASNHDFHQTPPKEELLKRLCHMQTLGADLPKLAVMPQSALDVLTLLEATEEMNRLYAKTPIITMSMSPLGTISRLAGGTFGSALTFGSLKKASAPGQIAVNELYAILNLLA